MNSRKAVLFLFIGADNSGPIGHIHSERLRMGDWLVYYKDYWIEGDYDPLIGGYHTKQEAFFNQVLREDSLWLVVNGGIEHPEDRLLFERIVVLKKQLKPAQRYYCVIGDPKKGIRFTLKGQSSLEPLLRKLQFRSGKKLETRGRMIGRSLQRIRPLSEKDAVLLMSYSQKLRPSLDKAI